MTTKQTVPVSQRALIQRINRVLAQDDQILKATRSERARQDMGDFYVLDTRLNAVLHKDVDPEDLGRELEVLRHYERVTE